MGHQQFTTPADFAQAMSARLSSRFGTMGAAEHLQPPSLMRALLLTTPSLPEHASLRPKSGHTHFRTVAPLAASFPHNLVSHIPMTLPSPQPAAVGRTPSRARARQSAPAAPGRRPAPAAAWRRQTRRRCRPPAAPAPHRPPPPGRPASHARSSHEKNQRAMNHSRTQTWHAACSMCIRHGPRR